MNRKVLYTIVVTVVVIGIGFAIINILAANELKKITNNFENQSEVQMTLKEYPSGRTINITDSATIKELYSQIALLQYNGLFLMQTEFDNTHTSYSLTVSSKEMYMIFVLSDSPSYVIGKNFSISIKNYNALYDSVSTIFK